VIQLRRQTPLLAAAIFWLLAVVAVPASASLGAGPGAQEVFEGEVGRLAPTLVPKSGASETVQVFRVEGAANQRIVIGSGGEVTIVGGDKTLFLNFGSRARAEEFLARRLGQGMSDATIKSFSVPKSFVEELRAAAVEEPMVHAFPARPIRVDITKAADQFGLRPEQIKALEKAILQGSGGSK